MGIFQSKGVTVVSHSQAYKSNETEKKRFYNNQVMRIESIASCVQLLGRNGL